jgi:molecular chaperone DnaK (HSP70)
MPSVVTFSYDGEVLIGNDVKEDLKSNYTEVFDMKRFIGREYSTIDTAPN